MAFCLDHIREKNAFFAQLSVSLISNEFMMSNTKHTTILAAFLLAISCNTRHSPSDELPMPNNGIEVFEKQLEGEEEGGNARERYEKLIHWTPDSADWQSINRQNLLNLYREKRAGKATVGDRSSETFANGLLEGTWSERGSKNQAGSLLSVDYEADENKIYGISDGGSLYRGNLDGTGWEVLEDDLQFDGNILQVVPNGTGKRILSAIGKQIYYSDDNGASWTQSTGLNYYDDWGTARQLIALNNGNAIYFLVFTWNQNPWGSRIWLMYSSDKGQSFSRIHTFPHNGNYWAARQYTRIWSPYGTNELYAVHTGTNRGTYQVVGGTVSLLNSANTLAENSEIRLSGYKNGPTFNLFTLVDNHTLYKSTNSGVTWSIVGSPLPADAWSVGIHASPFDANKLFFGEVNCYRSYNQGNSWTEVNGWAQYYGNTNYLHADIMDIKSFSKTDGTKFMLVANHGGLHISYDYLTTTTNIATTGLNISQYYDVRTDPTNPNYIYAGSQDQGHQRTSLGSNNGPVDFTQVISGDYGEYSFSDNGNRLWTVYPFGAVQYRYQPQTSNAKKDIDIPGTTPPAGDWIFPTAEVADAAQNKIYVAGGNLNGGTGSFLITLSALSAAPWTVSSSQGSFDFNAAAGAPISAIAASTVNTSRLYVATENGKLYHSNNGGGNWTAANSTNMSAYVNCVLPSKLDGNLVWMAGNGYSSPGVVVSTNGGQTFTSIANGLPPTQVRSIVANPYESLLFAATDAGPFVYVVSENQWYSMIGADTPIQSYRTVEYVSNNADIVRFSTYGRGVWDFNIIYQSVPLEWVSFKAKPLGTSQVVLDWETANEKDVSHFVIERSKDGLAFLPIGEMKARGGGRYNWTDKAALPGTSYYRLRQIDYNDKYEFSPVRSVNLSDHSFNFTLSPNPITDDAFTVHFDASDEEVEITVWDLQGRLIARQTGLGNNGQMAVSLPEAVATGIIWVQLKYRGELVVEKGIVR